MTNAQPMKDLVVVIPGIMGSTLTLTRKGEEIFGFSSSIIPNLLSLGRNVAVLAAVLNVLLFDIFFVPPRFSLAVSNLQYLVTFAVMLVTGLIAGQLAAGLTRAARGARVAGRRTPAPAQVAGSPGP